MKCEICGKDFIRLWSHLKKHDGTLTHGIDPKEYYDTYISKEKEHKCVFCGNEVSFDYKTYSYPSCCSKKCQYKLRWQHNVEARMKEGISNVFQRADVKEKIKNTMLEKYGVENARQSKEIQEKIKHTNQEKYGCEYGFQSDVVKHKIKETCIERYGKSSNLSVPEIREKIKRTKLEKYGHENYRDLDKYRKTMIERYGAPNIWQTKKYHEIISQPNYVFPSQTDIVKEKMKKTCEEKYGTKWFLQSNNYKEIRKRQAIENNSKLYDNENYETISFNEDASYFTLKHKVCGNIFTLSRQALNNRKFLSQELCVYCYERKNNVISVEEKEISNFVKKIFVGEIRENDRFILDGKELDIYIPEKKLAIEFDGVYWHSELYKENKYHLQKTEECERKGIQLIHVFEDEWKYKQEIVKSRLRGLLGLNERIFARKCAYRELTFEESKIFLDENHIQGNCVSKYRYGLFYNRELVSVMTFGESRFKKGEFELLRFANKLNTNVVGGASKLFRYFLKDHTEIKEIVSFADRRWSKGNLYEKLGFSEVGKTIPNYYYIIDDHRENRIKFQKHKLIAAGAETNKTEHEIMLEKGCYRIYDCGNLKYRFRNITHL